MSTRASDSTSREPAPTPEPDDDEYDGDDWCISCGDEFHYDDCGGYNPPCSCGYHCRHCHEAEEGRLDPDNDYDDEDETHV